MRIIMCILITVFSYLLGCASASIFLSRLIFKRDVRSCGSGNAGATNMARSFGILPGIATLLFDAAKAAAAVLIGRYIPGDCGLFLAGTACLIGHCFPVFHNFKGGKGVSVCAALMFFIDWRIGIIVFVLFFAVALLCRKVSVASMCCAAAIFILSLIFPVALPGRLLALVCMVLVILRHKENIQRLIAGTEPDFKLKKTSPF